jgi:hypothetical protein
LFSIPVATFGGVDRGSEVEVVAGSSSCVQEVDSFDEGSVMMWEAISNDRKTYLVHVPGNLTAVRYRDDR